MILVAACHKVAADFGKRQENYFVTVRTKRECNEVQGRIYVSDTPCIYTGEMYSFVRYRFIRIFLRIGRRGRSADTDDQRGCLSFLDLCARDLPIYDIRDIGAGYICRPESVF